MRAKALFDEWKAAGDDYETAIDPNLKSWALCSGIQGGTPEDWDLAWDRLQHTSQILGKKHIFMDIFGPEE